MGRGLEEVTAELAEVADALLALAVDDFASRYALLKLQDELRAEADRYRTDFDEQRPTEDVLAELAEVRQRRDAEAARLSGRVMLGGGNAGFVSADIVTLAAKAEQSGNLAELIARVGKLESLLIARGVAIDDADDAGDRGSE